MALGAWSVETICFIFPPLILFLEKSMVPTRSWARAKPSFARKASSSWRYAHGRLWIPETCGAHFDGAGARDQKFRCVDPGRDAPQADHRNLHGLGRFVDHAQGDRLDGGSG